MELLEYPFSLLILFVALFFIINRFRSHNKNKKLPPQPWKLPIIGHLHHLTGEHPHRALKHLAEKLGPIFHLQLGECSAIIISSPSVAKDVLKNHDVAFSNRAKRLSVELILYNYGGLIFAPYSDYWRQMRKICILELLSAKKVSSFRSSREQESWHLVESVAKLGSTTVNLSELIVTMTNTMVSKVVVGGKSDDQVKLIELIGVSVSHSSGFDLVDLFPSIKLLPLITGRRKKLMNIHYKMDEILNKIIAEHEERRRREKISHENEDLLDVLLRLKYDGGLEFPLSFDNIKAIVSDMFIAGTDTSSVTFEWAMSELIRNPEVMKKAQAEVRQAFKGKTKIYESDVQDLVYLKLVLKETFRFHPPVPLLIPRECREKSEISGYEIPVNTQVIVNTWKIGRDPDYWVDPESFIPERFIDNSINMMGTDFEYLPFGAGRRMCPGLLLGLANIELPLALLLYYFNWELPNGAGPEELDITESFGATLKLKNDLFLVATPYNNDC